MKGYELSPGTTTYDMVTGANTANIEGNILPPQWLKRLRRNNLPYTTAAVILSDIVYWYRPIYPRDEKTGQPLPPRKKFKGDKLQRSYSAFVDLYGYSKKQVTEACYYLQKEGLIDLDLRTVHYANGKAANNVLYIGLAWKKVLEISTIDETLYPKRETAYTPNGRQPIPQTGDTNTETTTEITIQNMVASPENTLQGGPVLACDEMGCTVELDFPRVAHTGNSNGAPKSDSLVQRIKQGEPALLMTALGVTAKENASPGMLAIHAAKWDIGDERIKRACAAVLDNTGLRVPAKVERGKWLKGLKDQLEEFRSDELPTLYRQSWSEYLPQISAGAINITHPAALTAKMRAIKQRDTVGKELFVIIDKRTGQTL